jgi:uncharacterized phiE125 gp8 family phage protein
MNAYPRRTGEPVVEPITLAEALYHLKEDADGSLNDGYVNTLITVARMACEDRTERTLVSTAWRLTLDAFPSAIELHQPPIISVESVEYTDEDGATQTLDPSDYKLDAVSVPGYIVPAFGKSWPATRNEVNAVRVNYTAGYGATAESVPKPLIQWMFLAIGDMYTNRNASSDRPAVKHNFVDSLLDPYKVMG